MRLVRSTSTLWAVVYASARDLARFGLLYLRRGRWGDQQVIPAEWVDESTRPYSITNSGSGYGYLWWTAPPEQPFLSVPPGSYFAAGNGGQYVFVIPANDLVIVHLARMDFGWRGTAERRRADASISTAVTHPRRSTHKPMNDERR